MFLHHPTEECESHHGSRSQSKSVSKLGLAWNKVMETTQKRDTHEEARAPWRKLQRSLEDACFLPCRKECLVCRQMALPCTESERCERTIGTLQVKTASMHGSKNRFMHPEMVERNLQMKESEWHRTCLSRPSLLELATQVSSIPDMPTTGGLQRRQSDRPLKRKNASCRVHERGSTPVSYSFLLFSISFI